MGGAQRAARRQGHHEDVRTARPCDYQAQTGQAIPVVGVVIGAGLNASYLQSVGRDAELAYRMCFLAEKHGLDPSDLAPPPTADDATGAGDYNRHPGDRRRRAAEARTGGRRPGVLTLFVLS